MSRLVRDLIHQHIKNTLPPNSSAVAKLAEIERFDSDLTRKLGAIAADSRLTTGGREDAARDAGRETLAKLKKWHEPLRNGLDAHENQLVDELRAAVIPSRPKDPADRGTRRAKQVHV